MRWTIASALRLAGVAAVLALSLAGHADGLDTPAGAATWVGVAALATVLWLAASGAFGYGDAGRADWVALLPFAAALLLLREAFTLHSVQEIEIQFARGPIGRHSVVYPLRQLLYTPLVGDGHAVTMRLNGVLGAVASLGAYLFVRQRTTSRAAGFLCASFVATHPLLVRFSPTDGPYAFLLATWFAGLALLSAPRLDARGLFGGTVLLAIAATARMEGSLFLLAALLLLDRRALAAAVRRHRAAAGWALLAGVTLAAAQMGFLLPFHLRGPSDLAQLVPPFDQLWAAAVSPAGYNPPAFLWLVWLGAVAGLVMRARLGARAYLAMLVVLAPVANSWLSGAIALHRMIPAIALQAIVAGLGAHALTAWLPLPRRWQWLAVLPGVALAGLALAERRAELSRAYVFTAEYDLVRAHLAPGGAVPADCTLLTCNWLAGYDIDLHAFGQVVPGMRVVDCRRADCAAESAGAACVYYVRSAGCYFHPGGVPPACAAGVSGNPTACLDGPAMAFERAVTLQPIAERTIELTETFPDRRANYPARAPIGLYRVSPGGALFGRGVRRGTMRDRAALAPLQHTRP